MNLLSERDLVSALVNSLDIVKYRYCEMDSSFIHVHVYLE